MDNNKLRRLTIIDDILSKGSPVSFIEIAGKLNEKLQLCKSEHSYSSNYGDNFRSDMKIIRDAIRDDTYGIRKDMLKSEGGNKYKRYWYAEPGFSILPYLNHNRTAADIKALNMALGILKDALSEDIFKNVEFSLKSRIEYEFSKGEKSIDYGENLALKGRHWLPLIYQSLNKTTLSIRYKPFYEKKAFSYKLHPYLLKQYNNRWHLFGRAEDIDDSNLKNHLTELTEDDRNYWNVPIDRIESIVPLNGEEFIRRPEDYADRFKGRIGFNGLTYDNDFQATKKVTEVKHVLISVHGIRTWGDITTKPLHSSQRTVTEFNDENKYGQISLDVIPNSNFFDEILGFGPGVEIIKPSFVREQMKKIVNQMNKRYN